ncbi:uncharacterized protein LOC116955557 [Petromyzon marinus]|uniref:SH3 domain-binding glutamic acid-rich-like protein 3 n=1 Tax=Petromyzon marinus TaxID=7757 RepID=A0AAJ7UBB2_PETMA|nr:neurofilament medium polypeptide-like [Petromyzon marinus]
MAVDVYYTSVTPSRQIRQRQREVTRILESRRVPYQLIDVSVDERVLEEMRRRAGDPSALPPQIFNEGDYLGDYVRLYEAVEDEAFELFLKFAPSPGDKPLIRVDLSRCRADDREPSAAQEASDSSVEVKAMVSRYEQKVVEKYEEESLEEEEEEEDEKQEKKKKLAENVGEGTRTPASTEQESERPLVTTQSLLDHLDTAATIRGGTAEHPEAGPEAETATESRRLPEIKSTVSAAEGGVDVALPKPISIPPAFRQRAEAVVAAPVATAAADGSGGGERSDALPPDDADGKWSNIRRAEGLTIGAEPMETAPTQSVNAPVTTAMARTSELPQILQAVLVAVPSNMVETEAHRTPPPPGGTVAAAAAPPQRRRQAPAVPMRQKKRPEKGVQHGKGRAPLAPTAGGDQRRGEVDAVGREPGKLVQVSIREGQAVVRCSVLEPAAPPVTIAERHEEKEVEVAKPGKAKKSKKARGMCSQQ